ncbi:hypothetical protein QNJ28_00480 [Macrococcus caseolyticus]|uniref:hypothetical protein n=1 Tax=Macrococcoides caseolyticum TaxID=69966 RepID=UPI0024BCA358|nr:hypothetical protein [Macrococcus caseolyticus]MDJ1108561.1 hypothetical protein [Macrococcus caseolyticus]
MSRNHRHNININSKDSKPTPPPGTGSGGGPLNEDIEKRHDPYRDYGHKRSTNHELKKPDENDFKFLFGDDD